MNRLLCSALGVILTFAWIVYTAPSKQSKRSENQQIKKISKSGSTSLHTMAQPINKVVEADKKSSSGSYVYSGSKVTIIKAKEMQY